MNKVFPLLTLALAAPEALASTPSRRLFGPFFDLLNQAPLDTMEGALKAIDDGMTAFKLDSKATGQDRLLVASRKWKGQTVRFHKAPDNPAAFTLTWPTSWDWNDGTCRYEMESRLGLPSWKSDREHDQGTLYWAWRGGLLACDPGGLHFLSPGSIPDLHDWIEVPSENRLPDYERAEPAPTGLRVFTRPTAWEAGAPFHSKTWIFADPKRPGWLARFKLCARRVILGSDSPTYRVDGLVMQLYPEDPARREAPGRPDIEGAIQSAAALFEGVRLGFLVPTLKSVGNDLSLAADPATRTLGVMENLLVSTETRAQVVTVGVWRRTHLPDDIAVQWRRQRAAR